MEKVGKLDKDGTKKLAELKDKMNKIIGIKKAHGIKIKSYVYHSGFKQCSTPTGADSDHLVLYGSIYCCTSKKVEAPKPVSVAEQARDPTRSIYYDPVLNPYGAPPPGQPYLEYRKIFRIGIDMFFVLLPWFVNA